jgi:hypothetical protein
VVYLNIFSLVTDENTKDTGWCLFDSDNNKVLSSSTLYSPNNMSFIKRSIILSDSLKSVLKKFKNQIDIVCLEELYFKTNTRHTVDLIKLSGVYSYIVYTELKIIPILIKPFDWISYFNVDKIKNMDERKFYVLDKIQKILNIKTETISETYAILLSYYYSLKSKGVEESWINNTQTSKNMSNNTKTQEAQEKKMTLF